MEPLFIFAGIISLIVVAVTVAWYKEKKRTEALKALAASMNFSFSEKEDQVASFLEHFPLFSQGHAKRVFNLMRGSANDIDVMIILKRA